MNQFVWHGVCLNPRFIVECVNSGNNYRLAVHSVLTPETKMPAPAPIIVKHIDHITLVVKSVDASRNFYVGLLGMLEVPRPDFDFAGAWFQAGATLIHLIEEHDRSGPAGFPDEVLLKSSRNHHFAFEVADAHAAAKTLKAMGIELVDDAKTRPDGAVQVFLTDPDGHVVELCTSNPQ